MSLRDQLMKAGLADKKKAKAAEREARKRDKQRAAEQRKAKGETTPDEAAAAYEAKLAADRQRAQELNAAREAERLAHERQQQAIDLVDGRGTREGFGDEPYYFAVAPHTTIHALRVGEALRAKLATGQMGIVRPTPRARYYFVMARADCLRVQELWPALVVCLHAEGPAEPGAEEASPQDEHHDVPETAGAGSCAGG